MLIKNNHMIHESCDWKAKLKEHADTIEKRMGMSSASEKAARDLEFAILNGMFICRKLMDSPGKISMATGDRLCKLIRYPIKSKTWVNNPY